MKVLYIGILQKSSNLALELCSEKDLSSFSLFIRSQLADLMVMFCKKVANSTKVGDRYDALAGKDTDPKYQFLAGYTFHVFCPKEGVVGMVISDSEYPERVVQVVLGKAMDQFLTKYPATPVADPNIRENSYPLPELKDYIGKDLREMDAATKIQADLDDTMNVMKKSLGDLLDRGEKIDELVQKSDNLSSQSKMFYTQAKKQNSCCTIM